ncbi:alpha/beta hydrolase, partial [Paenibacillus sp. HN-1]
RKALSIFIAVILWLLVGFLFLRHAFNAPMVKEGYYIKVDAAYTLEQKYTKLGEYETRATEIKSGETLFDTYKVWYPSALEQNNNEKFPIVVMANGTGVPFSKFSPIFEHLASWGFVVIGNNDSSSWTGVSSSDALKFIIALNENSKSVFYNKLDTKNIGISGHSQGGVGAINAVTQFTNSNMFTSIYTASATSMELSDALKWSYDATKIKIPYFMVAGTGKFDSETIAPLASLNENFGNLNDGIPAVMARRRNVDHGEMLAYADGYMTAWFRYTLMNDEEASKVFRGDSPEIKENTTNWQDVHIKNIK